MAHIYSVTFNEDHSLFVSAGEDGARIFNVSPLRQMMHVTVDQVGSLHKGVISGRSNVLWLISGGMNPKYREHVLQLWDSATNSLSAKLTYFEPIINVVCHADISAIVREKRTDLYSNSPGILLKVQTRSNHLGVCKMSTYLSRSLLYYLGKGQPPGTLHISTLTGYTGSLHDDKDNNNSSSSIRRRLSESSSPTSLRAHQHEINRLAISSDGHMFATSSFHGTLIRVWKHDDAKHDDESGVSMISELRRGSDTAKIYCLTFSDSNNFISVTSDKGTVHIFSVSQPELNKKSMVHAYGMLGSYANSTWSFGSFSIPPDGFSICAVSEKEKIVVAIGTDKGFHTFSYRDNGACNRNSYINYVELGDDSDI